MSEIESLFFTDILPYNCGAKEFALSLWQAAALPLKMLQRKTASMRRSKRKTSSDAEGAALGIRHARVLDGGTTWSRPTSARSSRKSVSILNDIYGILYYANWIS